MEKYYEHGCRECDKIYLSKGRGKARGFCSFECRHNYTVKRNKLKQPSIEIICEECGKTFIVHKPSNVKRKFCSHECHYKYLKHSAKEIKCPVCGEIRIRKSPAPMGPCENCTTHTSNCEVCGRRINMCKKDTRRWICKKWRLFPTLIKYFGFDEKVLKTIGVLDEFLRIQSQVQKEYDEDPNIEKLMIKHNYTGGIGIFNFCKILNSLEIKFKEDVDERKTRKFCVTKYHTSWDNKQWFLRSSLEEEYAKKLDEEKIEYTVGKICVKYIDTYINKERRTFCDFYLPKENKIIEIKGYYYNVQNLNDKAEGFRKAGYTYEAYSIIKKRNSDCVLVPIKLYTII